MNSFNGLLNVYAVDVNGTPTANNNYALAINSSSQPVDADWQIYPVISHSLNTVATPDVPCLTTNNLAVNFDFVSADTSMILNPIFNVNAFMIQYLGGDKSSNRYYATANFDNSLTTEVDTLDAVMKGEDFNFDYTYSSTGTKSVEISQYYKSWGWTSTAMYTSVSNLTLSCAGIEEVNTEKFVVYPNPARGLVNVSLNNVNGTISLLSADGKVIETREVSSNTETFNVSSLNAGIYFIQVGQSVQKLMVK